MTEAPGAWPSRLRALVLQRAAGRPLQYILGTEFFGDLEIACRPGVLIPRQETAASITFLAERLQASRALPQRLRILDLCTGTGCIPLLFEGLFRSSTRVSDLQLLGVDVSSRCVNLARYNGRRCELPQTKFAQADILAKGPGASDSPVTPLMGLLRERGMLHWDILISNPPYISPQAFVHTTTRSVRNFEPKLALVPISTGHAHANSGDLFYPTLLDIADQVNAKVVLFEVADTDQALRVAHMAQGRNSWQGIEIWRDEPSTINLNSEPIIQDEDGFRTLGRGDGRSVVCWRAEACTWLNSR